MNKKNRGVSDIILTSVLAVVVLALVAVVLIAVITSIKPNEYHPAEAESVEEIEEIKNLNYFNERWQIFYEKTTRFTLIDKFTIGEELYYIVVDDVSNVTYLTNGEFFTPLINYDGNPLIFDYDMKQ